MKIEDYAIIGDTQTLALVGRNGSIDWLCLPRFDSGACFSSLLGSPDNGRWLVSPKDPATKIRRQYRRDTLVLETEFSTATGTVRLIDFMPVREQHPDLVRIVEGVSGSVAMCSELVIRFDYGSIVPWVKKLDGRLHAIGGPDALVLQSPITSFGRDFTSVAEFEVRAGERVPFVLTWYPSHQSVPESTEPYRALDETESWWHEWLANFDDGGEYRDAIVRSLITLKALTFGPSGGIVAAGTTSLPENLGGVRNWDYRYCWLRDSTFTLLALLHSGFTQEAQAFRDWLLRAVAGDPAKLQIMYGLLGERRLDERSLEWLSGYEHSQPVRIGNAASGQLQLDVYGEVSDTLHQATRSGLSWDEPSWALQRALAEWLESNWNQPDEGIWEPRGGRRQFTYSKVMTWVTFDRAIKGIERHSLSGPVERWRGLRDTIHRDVCEKGWNEQLGTFVQYYGANTVDASLLLMPAVGFLPGTDPRIKGTIRVIEEQLLHEGFVRRYRTDASVSVDGLPGTESTFLACSFWLVDAYLLCGRTEDARRLFRRLLAVANDVGLYSEEYDPMERRLLGNFPQAFSHVALINSARNLVHPENPARQRSRS